MDKENSKLKVKNKKTMIILFFTTLLMFAFAYALVPLYNVLCSTIGLNGKTSSMVAPLQSTKNIDYSRTIIVEFIASRNAELPWQFYPLVNKITLHPGENKRVAFFAENDSAKTMTVQAIPSVAPGDAAKYLKKTECFCFRQQTLKSKEALDMPLIFHIDKEIPASIKILSLSYTLFDAENFKSATSDKLGKIR
jgi:cytochrome c oxidase assembly protein subunit 11